MSARSQLPAVLKRGRVLVGFVLVAAAIASQKPEFLDRDNLVNVVRQTSIPGIMAVGMTFVILTGGIDLSVGSTLALAGVCCATLERAGWPLPVVVLGALGTGALVGLANGLVITRGRVAPFVVTLGTMSIVRGWAHISTDAQPISRFGEAFRWIGTGSLAGVPVPIVLFLGAVLAAAVVLGRTRLGRYTYAIGGNVQAARLSGVNVAWHTTMAYVICGLTAGASALVLTSRLNAAESKAGLGDELDVIASVVIGGTSLSGGRGSVWGTLLGALLIGMINNGMNLMKISAHWQLVVKGAIIVAAVLVDRFWGE